MELEKAPFRAIVIAHSVWLCTWASIITPGANAVCFSHSTVGWVRSLLRNHELKENDLTALPMLTKTHLIFLEEHKQGLTETLYILSSYSLYTEIKSTFTRLTVRLHVSHSYQVTLVRTEMLPDAVFHCSYFNKHLLKQGFALKKCYKGR